MTGGLIRGHNVHTGSSRFFVGANQSTLAPPLPPQFPTSPGAGPAAEGSYFSRSFNSNVVVVMAVLLFALVVAACINTMARCILQRGRPQPGEESSRGGRQKGLEKSEIEALPVVAYGAAPIVHLDCAGSECVVCLSEFVAGEQLRLLPGCNHGFHVACIDTWLLTHISCPVCRHSAFPADSSESDVDPSCTISASDDRSGNGVASRVGGSNARLGSSRFGSARIASHDLEIEVGPVHAGSAVSTDAAGASSSSRPKRSLGSILSAESLAGIIHGVGSRRSALRIQPSSV